MFVKGLLLLLAANFLSAEGLHSQPETRIIGGRNINIESAPWQVSLRHLGGHSCGGSIYNETIIITAAHCFFNHKDNTILKAKNFEVLAGSANQFSSNTIVKVAAIKPHPNYIDTLYDYDIGIVKLSEPLNLTTKKMQRIALADKDPAPETWALATGWGNATRSGESYIPAKLKAVEILIQEPVLCDKVLGYVQKYSICGGNKGFTTCKGDSGGPLVVKNKLVGVVSRGKPLCTDLSVFVSVSELSALL